MASLRNTCLFGNSFCLYCDATLATGTDVESRTILVPSFFCHCCTMHKYLRYRQSCPRACVVFFLCVGVCRYFSDPRHQAVLFPTLVAICHDNLSCTAVAENELAMELLADFFEVNLKARAADESPVAGVAQEVNSFTCSPLLLRTHAPSS